MTDRGANEFSSATKRSLALRAGYRCSLCKGPTVGPSDESPTATTNIGVAAHICEASPGSKRFDASMSPEQRSDISNGIWLCSDHAALIDRDEATYTTERLHGIKRDHEIAGAESLRRARREGGTMIGDLIAFGPDVICTGELIGVEASEWNLRINHFVVGDFNRLIAFIDRFRDSPESDRYVSVNALGDARVLTGAPNVRKSDDGYLVSCAVDRSFPRIEAQQLGTDFAIWPETNDLFPKSGTIAVVSGLDALPQTIRSNLSMQRGESLFNRGYGARLGEYFDAFRGSPWLEQLLKLDVIRQAAIPYHDGILNRRYTPLQCVERVHSIEVLAEMPVNNWLPVRVDFEVKGIGRWQHDLAICMPSGEDLRTIRDRQELFAAIENGVQVSRDAFSAFSRREPRNKTS
jgi:hypothetical protein